MNLLKNIIEFSLKLFFAFSVLAMLNILFLDIFRPEIIEQSAYNDLSIVTAITFVLYMLIEHTRPFTKRK